MATLWGQDEQLHQARLGQWGVGDTGCGCSEGGFLGWAGGWRNGWLQAVKHREGHSRWEEQHEQRRGSGWEGRADPPCPGLPPQRLYSMDLRSSHKAKGKEKLCFSLTRPLGSGSPEGVVKAGAPMVDKGPMVPALPFPLRKPRKAHKYLRLSRKKFPPRGPDLESHSHPRELFLQEPAAPDVLQAASEWEPAEQPPEEEGKASHAQAPECWGGGGSLEPSGPSAAMPRGGPRCFRGCTACRGPGTAPSSSWGPTGGQPIQAGKTKVVTSSRASGLELDPELAAAPEGGPGAGWAGIQRQQCRQCCP